MRRLHECIIGLALFALLWPATGEAIPAFTRQLHFNCMMCHAGYPKLNDFGQRFRDNGYQLEGQEESQVTIFDGPPPLALRTTPGFTFFSGEAGDAAGWETTDGFALNGLDLLAAGVVHKNVSVLVIYTPRIDEPAGDFTGTMPRQPGALESANVVFSNLVKDALSLRVGRFEPAYHIVSSKRSYFIMEGYEVYGFPAMGRGFVFEDNQIGIEATGHFGIGFKYGAGVVNGTGALPDNDKFKDWYAAATQTVGPGDGQTAGQRVGAFVYCGHQPAAPVVVPAVVPPTGEGALRNERWLSRYGASVALNWKTLGLTATCLRGRDDKALNLLDPGRAYVYNGGFVELDWTGCANDRLVASALFNWVNPPSWDHVSGKIAAYSALARYYFGDWNAPDIALHCEYTYRETRVAGGPILEHIGSALVDMAF